MDELQQVTAGFHAVERHSTQSPEADEMQDEKKGTTDDVYRRPSESASSGAASSKKSPEYVSGREPQQAREQEDTTMTTLCVLKQGMLRTFDGRKHRRRSHHAQDHSQHRPTDSLETCR
eukprot:GHVS01023129.1.p2 GENE.GHVS01023129.1~~GHVS01023129.1.p2  ORF type:complete len:119 (+),score=20.48 GHVS01023129.1:83-439(+)